MALVLPFLKCMVALYFFLMGGPYNVLSINFTRPVLFFPDHRSNFPTVIKPNLNEVFGNGDYQSQANSLSSMEDFANFFKFKLPADKPSISVRLGVGVVSETLSQATCTPDLTPVPLDIPRGGGYTYFPTCVRVERCGGCCLLGEHSCQPTSVEIITVKSVRVEDEVTKPRRRRVRNAQPEYVNVDVEKHLACECKCVLQKNDCNPAIHYYNGSTCECKCKDSLKEESCRSSNRHFWDSRTCECLCRNTLSCSTGTEFNHETCSCN